MKALLFLGRFAVFLVLYLPARYVLEALQLPVWAAAGGAFLFAVGTVELLARWHRRRTGGRGGRP
ncbi:hypothetical protein [Deinococcus aquaedulcis]|uniref:hypothetical protein n=1 Tax=Deinococcus aquaedulcis TaxID=2840455 RepID=UPI001C83460D|nr:hypothetical protein [Deinococcus aquaedulcis]